MKFGTYNIRERGSDKSLAKVKLVKSGGGLFVYVMYPGDTAWKEDPDAYGLLFGDAGAVEFVSMSSLVAACHSAACAPPPAGVGGSRGSAGKKLGTSSVTREYLDRNDSVPTSRMGMTYGGTAGRAAAEKIAWDDVPVTTLPKGAKLVASEKSVKTKYIKRVLDGEPLREGYEPQLVRIGPNKFMVYDGHHRMAMHAALGNDNSTLKVRIAGQALTASGVSYVRHRRKYFTAFSAQSAVFACLDASCAPPPVGSGGSSRGKGRGARRFPAITAAEARGDSRPVSAAEFQRLATRGQAQLDVLSAKATGTAGLDRNWPKVKEQAFAEVQKSWGGATIDARTGKPLPQGANAFAITVKPVKMQTVSVSANATQAQFDAAMDRARKRYGPILDRKDHYLGVFHDDENGRIDIDPVLVVRHREDVDTIGAATRAIGGAYNFSDGNGYWPPHVP